MTDKQTASKLMERVNDWQSYLGRTETPHDIPTAALADPAHGVRTEIPPAPVQSPEPVATMVEVAPPPVEEKPAATTVIEVLPPDRPARPNKSDHLRAEAQRAAHGALFNDARHAEAEYNHARRANAVLSVFVVMLLGVLFTVISWLMID